jgi:hypothetical protein
MLRYGTAVKLTRDIKHCLSQHFQKTWEKQYKIEDYKPNTGSLTQWGATHYCYLIIPKGTIAVLSRAYVDRRLELYWIRLRNPKTKQLSNFNIRIKPEDFDTEMDPVERGTVLDMQRKLAMDKPTNDNFEKIKALQRMLEVD